MNKLFLEHVMLENRSSLIIGELLASDYDSEMIRCPLRLNGIWIFEKLLSNAI